MISGNSFEREKHAFAGAAVIDLLLAVAVDGQRALQSGLRQRDQLGAFLCGEDAFQYAQRWRFHAERNLDGVTVDADFGRFGVCGAQALLRRLVGAGMQGGQRQLQYFGDDAAALPRVVAVFLHQPQHVRYAMPGTGRGKNPFAQFRADRDP